MVNISAGILRDHGAAYFHWARDGSSGTPLRLLRAALRMPPPFVEVPDPVRSYLQDRARDAVRAFRRERSGAADVVRRAQARLDAAWAEIQACNSRAAELESELATARAELQAAREGEARSAAAESQHAAERTELRAAISACDTRAAELEARLAVAEAQHATDRAALAAQEARHAADGDRLRAAIAERDALIAELKVRLAAERPPLPEAAVVARRGPGSLDPGFLRRVITVAAAGETCGRALRRDARRALKQLVAHRL